MHTQRNKTESSRGQLLQGQLFRPDLASKARWAIIKLKAKLIIG